MKDSGLLKKMVPIYLTSFIAWFHNIVYTPLGYMYNTYPDMEGLVMLIAVLPGVVAMGGGFLAGKLMDMIGKKRLVLFSIVLMMVGGLGMFLLGSQGIYLAIMFSGISGFAAGTIPAANYALLAEIAPEHLRDKVCGWSDAVCSLGLVFSIFTCGILASDGVWTRGYAVYFAAIPILLLALIWYPKDSAVKTTEEKAEEAADDSGESVLPACIIALLGIKMFAGMFYSSFGVFGSDYIINDLQLGSSALVGTVNTVTQVVNIAASAAVFLWLKFFKGFSTFVAQIVIGVFMLGVVLIGPSIAGITLCAGLLFVGLMSSHSSLSTIMAMAPKGKAVGTVSGIFVGMTFIGESLCGYAAPIAANIFLGSSSATNCMKISAIISLIVGVISLPFFSKAYKLAFKKEDADKTST